LNPDRLKGTDFSFWIGRRNIRVKDMEALLRIVVNLRGNETKVRTAIYN